MNISASIFIELHKEKQGQVDLLFGVSPNLDKQTMIPNRIVLFL